MRLILPATLLAMTLASCGDPQPQTVPSAPAQGEALPAEQPSVAVANPTDSASQGATSADAPVEPPPTLPQEPAGEGQATQSPPAP